jgi:hypothetical protein
MSWNGDNKLEFNVYKKLGELAKYLNVESHHHRHHKTAVLSGVELHLALLTIMTDDNADVSLSEIYPDKHEALLSIAGQLKLGRRIRTMREVLTYEPRSNNTRREKGSRHIDKSDTFFICKYATLGHRHRPINQVIKRVRNSYRLKWLRPRVI